MRQAFFGVDDRHYCLECAKKVRTYNVVMTRTCVDCGRTFEGGPRAKRCLDCRELARKETSWRHKKNGTRRPLGSLDKCEWCGAEYTVSSGRQKHCSVACQRLAVLEWQRERKKRLQPDSQNTCRKTAQTRKPRKNMTVLFTLLPT